MNLVAFAPSGKPVFRCSSLDRLLTCNGSRTLEEMLRSLGFLKDEEQGHAVQWAGSWCHHHAARILRDDYGAVGQPDPLRIPESFIPSGYDEWVVDWYVRRVTTLVPNDWAMWIEREIVVEFPRFFLSGHLDVSSIDPTGTKAIIDDLKRGYDVVDAAEYNWQLAGYLALLGSVVPTLESATLRIHQPAAPDRTTEAHVTNVAAVIEMLERNINAALDNALTFTTGKSCKYCPAAVAHKDGKTYVCPTLKKDLLNMKETLTKEFIESLVNFSELDEFGEFVSHAKKLQYPTKRLIDAFKEALEAAGGQIDLKDGTTARIVDEEGPREITDPRTAHGILARKVGENESWTTLSMSVGKVGDVLAKTGMKKSSKNKDVETTQTWISNNLGGLINRPTQKTLVIV